MQQMFGAHQPIIKNLEKPSGTYFCRRIEILGKRTHSLFIDLEEKTVLAAKMLEDRSLGDAERNSHVANAGGMVTVFRKVLHGRIDNAGALGLRTRSWRRVAHITRWINRIAGNSTHRDSKSPKNSGAFHNFQLHFYSLMQ